MKRIPVNSNVFIFDIDGTICNFDKAFVDTAFSLSLIDELDQETISNRRYIKFSDCGFLTENDELKILKMFNVFHVWENLDIIPNSNDFIRKIMEKSCYLIYLTSRPDYLREQTITWIRKNGFPTPDEILNDDMNSRCILLMENKFLKKEGNMSKILDYHINNNLFYFENDPLFINKFVKNKIKYIYTFENSFTADSVFPKNVIKIKNYNNIDVNKLLSK